MAQVTQLFPSATPRGKRAAFVAKPSSAWTSIGCPILYTAANWTNTSFYFEVCMRATTGTARARLYDETAGTAVASSTLDTSSATLARYRTGALTLTDGDVYRSQFGVTSGDAGETHGAKLIGILT